ncbi:MAG: VOC family protein [Actinomycetales bacterium]|jgi:predicted enzyme related to lactoylglutathione lyase
MPALSSIMVNSSRASELADFWAAFLGTVIEHRYEEFIWLKALDGQTRLAFQQVDEPTPGRRRLHLDFGSDDVDADLAQAVRLGASRVEDHWSGSFHWFVLADPDGNEFCIGPKD